MNKIKKEVEYPVSRCAMLQDMRYVFILSIRILFLCEYIIHSNDNSNERIYNTIETIIEPLAMLYGPAKLLLRIFFFLCSSGFDKSVLLSAILFGEE